MADQPAQEKDPFEGFKSEAYNAGEPIEDAPADPPKKEEAPPPQKEEEAGLPAGGNEGGEDPPVVEGEEPVKEGEQPKKKQQSVQERINEVTRLRREAERREEAEKRRADAAEEELRRLRTAPPPKEEKKEAAADEVDPDAPDPNKFEYGELDSRYIRAVAEYGAEKKFQELRAKDEQERTTREITKKQEAARAKLDDMVARGSQKQEDFYEKVIEGSEKGHWPLSTEMGEMILGSEVGDEIAYHLATNPKEADEIFRSSPLEQARYFGRLEAKFSAGQAAASGTLDTGKPAPRTPRAPAPVETARGAGGDSQATADTDDFAAFEARVNSRG